MSTAWIEYKNVIVVVVVTCVDAVSLSLFSKFCVHSRNCCERLLNRASIASSSSSC